MDKIIQCFDNDLNHSIIKLSYPKIKNIINDLLLQLQFEGDSIKKLHKKLKGYRYVDDLNDIHCGRYIRWFNLSNKQNLKLTNGGIIIDIRILDDGIHLVCKNNINRKMQIKLDNCLIFQRITDQEHIILNAIKFLETK